MSTVTGQLPEDRADAEHESAIDTLAELFFESGFEVATAERMAKGVAALGKKGWDE
jgi:hypothetical protein